MRKNSGVAPSVAAVLDKCPQATENPGTGEPFTPKHAYEAFRSYCYDEGSVVPGDHQGPVQKTAFTPSRGDRRPLTPNSNGVGGRSVMATGLLMVRLDPPGVTDTR